MTKRYSLNGVDSSVELGKNGALIKNNSGIIEARSNADDAYVIMRGLAAVGNDDFVIKSQLDDVSTIVTEVDGNVDDLITLSGVAENSTDLGAFTGATITDNVTVKAALQELETALETVDSTMDIAGDTGTDTVNGGEVLTFEGGDGVVTTVTNNQASFAVDLYVPSTPDLTTMSISGVSSPSFLNGEWQEIGDFSISGASTASAVLTAGTGDRAFYRDDGADHYIIIYNTSTPAWIVQHYNGGSSFSTATNGATLGSVGGSFQAGQSWNPAGTSSISGLDAPTPGAISGGGTMAHGSVASGNEVLEFVGGQLAVKVLDEDNMASDSDSHVPTQQSVKAYVDAVGTDVTELELNQDDLITLSGVAENSTDLGTFTGATITDNVTMKTALQELETALETVDSSLDIAGDTGTDTVLGGETLTFTGGAGIDTVVTDNDVSFAIETGGVTEAMLNSAVDAETFVLDTGYVFTDATLGPNFPQVGDSIQTAIEALDGDVRFIISTVGDLNLDVVDLITLSGVAENETDLGTFTGSTISDNVTIKVALQDLETAYEVTDVNVDDLITLSGVAENSTDLGTFTGATITDNVTVKVALQELETAHEEVDANVNDVITLTGVAENATDLGTFTGSVISDNVDIKTALQELETEVSDITVTNNIQAVTAPFTFSDAGSTVNIGNAIPANAIITEIRVNVTTAFDGTGVSFEVGKTGSTSDIIADANVDLEAADLYMRDHLYDVGGTATQFFATVAATGATQGAGRALINYYIPTV